MRTPVHAAAKRGHAAMLVQRNTKNCEAHDATNKSIKVMLDPWSGGKINEQKMNRGWTLIWIWKFSHVMSHVCDVSLWMYIYRSAVDVAPGDSIQAMPFGRRRIRELDEAAVSGSAGWRHDDCTKWQGMLIYCHCLIGFVCECMCNWHLAGCGGASLASTPRENDELKMAHGINRCFHSIEGMWMDLRWSYSFPANTLANNRGLTWPKTLEGDWVAAILNRELQLVEL